MDAILIILGLLFTIAGLLGCILPALPGPPLSFIGLLLIHFTEKISLPNSLLWVMAVVTILISVLDYVIPVLGTKISGGTKNGVRGATIGIIFGFFAGPAGLILGPFMGAMVGEILGGKRDMGKILKAAFGSFLGFLVSIGLKLMASLAMLFYYLVYVIPAVF